MADSRVPAAWAAAARTRAALILMALLPGALTAYFAFNAGGYFAGEPAAAALVLLIVLAARIMLASDPAAGIGRGLLVAGAALALFALWTLVSGSWSDASGRALVEFDRALLYLVALVLFGSFAGGADGLRWMIRGLALAAVAVCAVALITRLLPGVWSVDYQSISVRLSYPVTYWNALGLLASVGIVLCFGMTSSEREARVVRVLSCAAIPLLAVALLITLSRGSILVALIGVVVFAVVGHPRALVSGLVAAGAATAVAVGYAYHSDLVLSSQPFTSAAREQGETLAVVVAVCVVGAAILRTLLLPADDRLAAIDLAPPARRRLLGAGVAAVVVALAAIVVAVDLPHQYDRFVNAEAVTTAAGADPRARLSDPSSNGRVTQWRIAFHQFERTPLRGRGAGTYEIVWNQYRPTAIEVRDGHTLYLEVLSELGLVGFAFIAAAILAILVGIALRVRGPNRALYATVFAAALAWAIAAGIDWHWEMAVVTLWFFALGGAALAREPRDAPRRIRAVLAARRRRRRMLRAGAARADAGGLLAGPPGGVARRVRRRAVQDRRGRRARLPARGRQPAAALRGPGVLCARRRQGRLGGHADERGRQPRSRQLVVALRAGAPARDGGSRPARRRTRGAAPQPARHARPGRRQALLRPAAPRAVAQCRAGDGDHPARPLAPLNGPVLSRGRSSRRARVTAARTCWPAAAARAPWSARSRCGSAG